MTALCSSEIRSFQSSGFRRTLYSTLVSIFRKKHSLGTKCYESSKLSVQSSLNQNTPSATFTTLHTGSLKLRTQVSAIYSSQIWTAQNYPINMLLLLVYIRNITCSNNFFNAIFQDFSKTWYFSNGTPCIPNLLWISASIIRKIYIYDWLVIMHEFFYTWIEIYLFYSAVFFKLFIWSSNTNTCVAKTACLYF